MKLRIHHDRGVFLIQKRHWFYGWRTVDMYYTIEMAEIMMERMMTNTTKTDRKLLKQL